MRPSAIQTSGKYKNKYQNVRMTYIDMHLKGKEIINMCNTSQNHIGTEGTPLNNTHVHPT